jgi:hypothetical protein
MIAHGWHLVARSAGSKGAADLVMVHADHGLALVQVGTDGKTLGPADRARLCDLADLCSALPVLATIAPRTATQWWLVGRDRPSGWMRWSPASPPPF